MGIWGKEDVCTTEWHFYVYERVVRDMPNLHLSHARARRGLHGDPVSSRVSGSQEMGGALRRILCGPPDVPCGILQSQPVLWQ